MSEATINKMIKNIRLRTAGRMGAPTNCSGRETGLKIFGSMFKLMSLTSFLCVPLGYIFGS